jgi:NADPH2:quinone reductase
MKAVVCKEITHYSEGLLIQDVPRCTAGKRQVVIDVLSCGIAFPDVLTTMGKHIEVRKAPFVIASEVCGTVKSIGEGVDGCKIGDMVFGKALTGGAAEEAVLDMDSTYKLPHGVSPHVAAGFELNYGTTYHALIDIAKLKKVVE